MNILDPTDLAALHFATLAVGEQPLLANGTMSASTVVTVNGVRYVVAVSRDAPGALGLSDAAPTQGLPPDAVKAAP